MHAANERLTPRAALERHQNLRLKSGLQAHEIAKLFAASPVSIPPELRELLTCASGFSSADFGDVDFTGKAVYFSFVEISPFGIPIATLNGNTWVIDIQIAGASMSVFYFSHDPPALVIQFDSLAEFIDAVGNRRHVTVAAKAAASEIYKSGSSGISVVDARRSRDPEIARFAENLSESLSVFDLRERSTLRGFAWGRAGADAECRRAGSSLIFAAGVR